MRLRRLFSAWVVGALSVSGISVVEAADIGFSSVTQEEFRDFSEELGLMISYLPVAPAEPLGILGFDAGLETTFIDIEEDRSYWVNTTTGEAPSLIFIPKLHVQKGLPFGVDVGAIYSQISQLNVSLAGAEVKWAVIEGNAALPAVALRGSYTKLSGVDDLSIETYGLDISSSKGFTFVTPYVGVGQSWIRSSSKTPLPLEDEQLSHSRAFVGVKVSFLVVNFVAEAHLAKTPLYTLRVNLAL